MHTYSNLNKIEISEKNLLHNYKYLSSLQPKLKIAPVLKSNAYGHGIEHVGQILDSVNAPFLCVDSLYEAYELLNAGIKTQILILGYTKPENLRVKTLPFSYCIYDLDFVEAATKYQPQADLHIFVDTGMNREGVRMENLPEFLDELKKIEGVNITGVMSHLAASELPEDKRTLKQLENFDVAQKLVTGAGFTPKYVHILNSAGFLNSEKFSQFNLGNIARIGLAIYGVSPFGIDEHLKHVLTFSTTIAQVKNINKGETIGYNFTYEANKDMKIAVLPVGYNDGIDKSLSNKGHVLINGIKCNIVGSISMNITTVDVSHLENVKVGTRVQLYPVIENTGKLAEIGIIPYETLVRHHPTTKRVIV